MRYLRSSGVNSGYPAIFRAVAGAFPQAREWTELNRIRYTQSRRNTRRDGKPIAPFVRKELRRRSMLPAEQRLRNNEDFRVVYKRGRSHVGDLAVLYVMRRGGDPSASQIRRIGFVVSKKQGDAVVRNRIKRRLREAVRLTLPLLREGPYDMIFVGRSRLKEAPWPEVQAAVMDLFRRAKLLNEKIDRGES